MDHPITVSVDNVAARALVTVQVSSTDASGTDWESTTTFRSDADGRVDLATATPQSGAYYSPAAMGIFTSMHPVVRDAAGAYLWSRSPLPFTITVGSAHTTVLREGIGPGVTSESLTYGRDGFVGQYWRPAPGTAPGPAVLEFGGEEGGLDGQLVGALLASHGFPTLDLAYFGVPRLPRALANIRLEYFATPLKWLGNRTGVNPALVNVLSGSEGAEAAFLLGVNYPHLVHGVIASVPAVATGWTLHGKPLPADVAVDRIAGPVLVDCAGSDRVTPSCPYANAVIARVQATGNPTRAGLASYPRAGHGLAVLVPYEATAPGGTPARYEGANPDANQAAIDNLWPRLLAFLTRQ
jgi:pimeloyl-ACP methyl ester carboxylesterase